MTDSLTFVARYLDDVEQRRDLLLKALQLFIQQGISAKRASDTAQSSHRVCSVCVCDTVCSSVSCTYNV